MSYLSGQLKRLLSEGFRQNELAKSAKISQGQFSKYVKGTSRPDHQSLNKLCEALPECERVNIATAHLLDETPVSARALLVIRKAAPPESENAARVREESIASYLPLDPDVRTALDYFARAAQSDQDIAAWIVTAYNIVKPK